MGLQAREGVLMGVGWVAGGYGAQGSGGGGGS